MTGFTASTDFPTASPFQGTFGGLILTAFVTKLDAAGSALVYSTYLGGSGFIVFDQGTGIAVDASGNACVIGFTKSADFPTASPFQAANAGSGDAFIAKIGEPPPPPPPPPPSVCTYAISPTSASFPASGGTGSVLVSTRCGWNAKSDVSWITITSGSSGGGTSRVEYEVAANPDPGSRLGTLTISSAQILTVTQAGTAPAGAPGLPPNSVVNGGSFRAGTDPNGAIAPGGIVAIFGTDLASDIQSASLPTTLGDTSVTFDDIAAPLFFVSPTQINAQVPFELMIGTGPVMVQMRRGSETSEAQPIGIAAASPGIFAMNEEGTGPGAILHAEDFWPVSESDPARPGEFLLIFCTGLGPVQPAVASGQVGPGTEPLARTISLPMVNIAGLPAQVSFSGLAPGFAGLYQVNVQVPAGVPSGIHEVEIIINGVSSNIVTVAVQ